MLISGQGRNLQALIDAVAAKKIPARIACVISSRADAPGLARAQAAGIPAQALPHRDYATRESYDAALAQALDRHAPEVIVLAGFMRILTAGFIARYAGRMLNIHPSLLPKYPGLKTHEAALAAGDAEHGATVHYVTEQLDGGPGIIQGRLKVAPQDDAGRLAERVMDEIELKIYPQAVAWQARGELCLRDGRAWLRGAPLAAPLTMADLEAEFR
ncbi:MAG TPA: phosphoribosylglycinamide formyltransferase [Nevskiaceae bacterium]|nr:phosphoribosylglycinamide formyltransferase [Nevskiaceae bacterium]